MLIAGIHYDTFYNRLQCRTFYHHKLKRRKALIWVSLVWLIAFTLTIHIIIVKKPTQDGECRELGLKEFEPSIYHHIDKCSVSYSTYHNSDLLHKNLALLTSTTRVLTKKIENRRKYYTRRNHSRECCDFEKCGCYCCIVFVSFITNASCLNAVRF